MGTFHKSSAMAFNRIHLIRQVDLFSLRLFLSAVEEGQIGRAALRENISASTATKRIQDLEEIADIKLFDRTPSGVSPTPAGEVLERHVRRIFAELDDMRTEISAFTEGVRGELHVASARSIIAPFLARELGDFKRQFPLVDPVVHEMENARIVQAVAGGSAEIGVFAAAAGLDTDALDIVPYREDWMVVVLPLDHPLARKNAVRFEELLEENLIAFSGMLGAFQGAAARLKREFAPQNVVHSAGVAISLAQAGLGVTVTPECLLGRALDGEVAVVKLDESWAKRQLLIGTPRDRTSGKAVTALMSQLLDRPGHRAQPA